MKKYHVLPAGILIFLILFYPFMEVQGKNSIKMRENETANFEDENLEAAIRDVLNTPRGDIKKDEVKMIKELTINQKNILSLEGIQNLINLEELDLMFNDITDISPLHSLINLEK